MDEGVVARLADALRFAPEDAALVRALVGDAIVVRDLEAARRLRASATRAALVTLDGAVLTSTGGSRAARATPSAAGMLDATARRESSRRICVASTRSSASALAHQSLRAQIAQIGRRRSIAPGTRPTKRELALVTAEKDLQKSAGQLEVVVARGSSPSWTSTRSSPGALDEAGVERDEAARALDEARAT